MIPESVVEFLQNLSFRSNANLRPLGAQIEYSEEMIEELIKCKNDPIYFIKNYVKVVHPDRGLVLMDLYEYQERMIRTYHDNKRVIFLTARQQGKCLHINTNVKIRNKNTKEVFELTLGELYAWQKTIQDEEMFLLQQRVSDSERKSVLG